MTEMGGIYNRALFKSAKTRPALNKLSKMGGISSLNKRQDSASRGVSGLGSISGAQPMMAPPPMMPQQQMAAPPMMPPQQQQMMPSANPMIPPSGPGYALGGLVPIAARGVAAAAPFIKEGVKRGASIGQQAANRFKSATTPAKGTGIIDVLKDPKTLQAAMESKKATQLVGAGLTAAAIPAMFQDLYDMYGEEKVKEKRKAIEDAAEDGVEGVADASLVESGVPPTPENKREFARFVLGEDINNIDEINQRIYDVAVASSIGKGPDAYAKAVIGGLGEFKKTAVARSAAAAGGSGVRDRMSREDMIINMIKEINVPNFKGETRPIEEVVREAEIAVDKILAQGSGGTPPPATKAIPADPAAQRQLLEQALKDQPDQREAILKNAASKGVNIEGL